MNVAQPEVVNFGGLDSPESDTQVHSAFNGTTVSGKTLLMRLLSQDAMRLPVTCCDWSRRFLLNPFDDFGTAWNIAADVKVLRVALEMAFTLIPEATESQPYFTNAARHLAYGVMFASKRGRLIGKRTKSALQRGSVRPLKRGLKKKSLIRPLTRSNPKSRR